MEKWQAPMKMWLWRYLMKSSASKIKMTSFDDLFDTEKSDDSNEKILNVKLEKLVPFKNHPFKVLDDEKMEETKESINKYGVLVPIIVRPGKKNTYEIISGHRRKHACELLRIEEIPVIVRDLDDEESTIIMVDSNIQRDNLSFSEKTFAYKMKLEAIKRKAGRPKTNLAQLGPNLNKGISSVELLAEESGESRNQIKRYIRLTELEPNILNMVDEKKIPFNTGVEISYLKTEEQVILLAKINELKVIPSMAQATKLKKYSIEGTLNKTILEVILLENNEKPVQVTLKANSLKKYFAEGISSQEIENTILKLLDEWSQKNKT